MLSTILSTTVIHLIEANSGSTMPNNIVENIEHCRYQTLFNAAFINAEQVAHFSLCMGHCIAGNFFNTLFLLA